MDIPRETVEIESKGHKIVAYTYITAPEARTAKMALFKGVEMETPEPGYQAARPKIPLENALSYERAQLAVCLVRVDDKSPFDVLDTLPADDYEEIVRDIRAKLPRIFLVNPTTPATPSPSSTN
jgi:hypothetical protein